ncbi:MAG: FtsQ-type POTRA domain-containing protein [Eggerthellaceae bacterium]|nr:FtsQ-type POTRA domain-containing protein [Eggerthellaceae bacterium]
MPAKRGHSAQERAALSSVRIGDLNQASRAHRVHKTYRNYLLRIFLVIGLVVVLAIAGVFVYNSSLFTIDNVKVTGVSHLTQSDMEDLAAVPAGTTLLRVNEADIKSRLAQEAWVKSVTVKRVFPSTLELAITERSIAAVVEVPVDNAEKMENWAISSDGIWLMAIPDQGSEEAATVNPQVYTDAASVLKITGVPYGISPQVGAACTDDNVNNALAIVSGFTTSLKDQVVTVSATGTETTTLILQNGIEIAFGTATDIRNKERVCLDLMNKYAGKITYINVRVVDHPSWRTID